MRYLLALLVASFTAMNATAEPLKIKTTTVTYKQGDTELEGYLARPDDAKPHAGVLICHEWTGPNPHTISRAEQLAKLGYIALVADVYGKGVRPVEVKDCAATSTIYKKDRELLRKRITAGLDFLRKQEHVDNKRIGVIGYCFGGLTALEVGRSGADVAAIVSFHGDLSNPTPADAARIKARVLVLHGDADPVVPLKDVTAFEEEMRKTKVDWQLVKYSGAQHSFTNPAAKWPERGAVYDEKTDKRSFQALLAFFAETLGTP